jgi:MFS family permease
MRWRVILIANVTMGTLIMGYGVLPFIIAILILGFMEGAVMTIAAPALDAYLASTADPRIQGRVQGAFATISTSGAALAALFGTVLYDLGHWVPFILAGGALIAVNLAAFRLIRTSEISARERQLAAIAAAVQAEREAAGDVAAAPAAVPSG